MGKTKRTNQSTSASIKTDVSEVDWMNIYQSIWPTQPTGWQSYPSYPLCCQGMLMC